MSEKTYQELLYEEKLDRINEKLDDLKDLLHEKASSGSVQRLENRVHGLETAHIPCASVMLVQKEVSEMKDKFASKTEFEGLKKEFEPIKTATESTVFFSQHPKLFKMVLIGAFVLLLISAIGLMPSWFMWRRWKTDMKLIEVQKTEQPKTLPEKQK